MLANKVNIVSESSSDEENDIRIRLRNNQITTKADIHEIPYTIANKIKAPEPPGASNAQHINADISQAADFFACEHSWTPSRINDDSLQSKIKRHRDLHPYWRAKASSTLIAESQTVKKVDKKQKQRKHKIDLPGKVPVQPVCPKRTVRRLSTSSSDSSGPSLAVGLSSRPLIRKKDLPGKAPVLPVCSKRRRLSTSSSDSPEPTLAVGLGSRPLERIKTIDLDPSFLKKQAKKLADDIEECHIFFRALRARCARIIKDYEEMLIEFAIDD